MKFSASSLFSLGTLTVAGLVGQTSAFQNPSSSRSASLLTTGTSSTTTTTTTTELNVKTVNPDNLPTSTGFERIKRATNVPYGDEQRVYRRTVYSHDDWKKHRNQNRFIVYLVASFKSGVYKNIAGEVLLTTAIATFVCFYNLLLQTIGTDFLPKIGLPMEAFTLTSPSLGLLLGTYYSAWDDEFFTMLI